MNESERNATPSTPDKVGELVPFNDWLKVMKKSRTTGWNYRKRGAISTVEVFGRLYVSRAEIALFESRAAAGEFATT